MFSSRRLLSCFGHFAGDEEDDRRSSQPAVCSEPNSTICFYQTHLGLFSLTWSRTLIGHSLDLYLHSQNCSFLSSSSSSSSVSLSRNDLALSSVFAFNLDIKPFAFWNQRGSKELPVNYNSSKVQVFWDLTRAKFGSGPEPRSGFFVAVVVGGEIGILVGDMIKEGYARTRAEKQKTTQALILRRDHVFVDKFLRLKSKIGGKIRDISVDCTVDGDASLCFSVCSKRVLNIERLNWNFRGSESIKFDGVPIQISWDVYNWLFEKQSKDSPAVFMFRFDETFEFSEEREEDDGNGAVSSRWSSLGMRGIKEWRKMRRSVLKSGRSSSSSSVSMSSASSVCSSSVMEWASSADEAEIFGADGHGFSLIVYAWMK